MTGRDNDNVEARGGQERSVRVRVSDKRRSMKTGHHGNAGPDAAASEAAESPTQDAEVDVVESLRTQVGSLTDDLQRLGAEFDNYRKRMMRDQAEIGVQTTAALVKKLLPVLDNFDRAIAHGGDESVALLRKELMDVLTAEGVEEIPARGAPFDPHVHEAVESRDDPGIGEPTVTTVFRTGYRLGPKVLRAAMVGVARPAEPQGEDPTAGSTDHTDVAAGES
ncbi:MAG: nucleotide exchange factor GrpE [Actinomycetota bacterium]